MIVVNRMDFKKRPDQLRQKSISSETWVLNHNGPFCTMHLCFLSFLTNSQKNKKIKVKYAVPLVAGNKTENIVGWFLLYIGSFQESFLPFFFRSESNYTKTNSTHHGDHCVASRWPLTSWFPMTLGGQGPSSLNGVYYCCYLRFLCPWWQLCYFTILKKIKSEICKLPKFSWIQFQQAYFYFRHYFLFFFIVD